jgi:nucleotide-binding universal stress UspA family protein
LIFATVAAQVIASPGNGRCAVKVVIGANPDDAGRDALALGTLLCHALDAEPVLCHVHPADFNFPSQAHVDAEWSSYLHDEAEKVLAAAQAQMTSEYGWPEVRTVVGADHSSGQGLAEVASEELADYIVIGSAPGALPGAFQIGSTANKLLHGSPVPVAVAPYGYRNKLPVRIGKVVVGFRNTDESLLALAKGAEMADTADVPLLALTVLVRHRVYGSKLGSSAEDTVLAQLHDEAEQAQRDAVADLHLRRGVQQLTQIADSPRSALQRMEWAGDEVLVLASATGGPLRRVFLGDMTYKMLRSTPVPAIVLPRHTAG